MSYQIVLLMGLQNNELNGSTGGSNMVIWSMETPSMKKTLIWSTDHNKNVPF